MKPSSEQSSPYKKVRAFLREGGLTRNSSVKIALGALVVLLITLMFPHGETIDYTYRVGAFWADKDLLAPFSFPILKDPRQLEKEKEDARKEVIPIFRRNESIAETQKE